jgi:hypothetical protein
MIAGFSTHRSPWGLARRYRRRGYPQRPRPPSIGQVSKRAPERPPTPNYDWRAELAEWYRPRPPDDEDGATPVDRATAGEI